MCPACKGKKEKEHYNIFLFNLPTVNPEARPQGRFLTTMTLDALGNPVPEDFDAVSLFVSHVNDNSTLAPQDVCGWEGQLSNGVVSWRPSWLARLIK